MPIVTLTTDFGLRDYYVAAMKGALLRRVRDLSIVDISHNIKTFDIVQGAFMLKNAYAHFPPGTIHLVSVNNAPVTDRTFLAFRYDEHYFVGPDNGLFALAFGEITRDIYEIDYDPAAPFPDSEVFATVIQHFAAEKPFNEIGIPIARIEERISLQPVISPTQIRGSIIHIDNYENAILNINRELFERIGQQRNFALYFKRKHPITRLSQHYSEVPVGETLCRFNSADYLEIAVNMGTAATLRWRHVNDGVQIDFEPN